MWLIDYWMENKFDDFNNGDLRFSPLNKQLDKAESLSKGNYIIAKWYLAFY